MKKILSYSSIFNLFNQMIGEKKGRQFFVITYLKPFQDMKVLDIGCGIGIIIPYLGDVEYEGYDASKIYIDHAKKLYGKNPKINLNCELVESSNLKNKNYYDLVLASGLIHHLPDESCKKLFHTAREALKEAGRFVSFDNILVSNQSWIARKIILQDRGQFIRKEEDYKTLFKDTFPDTSFYIHHDILRIPYIHIIAVSTK
ncbi:MAG: class I SAM-dependent methyltransferase [Leptospiraceae bacterium]|nr:class I SAM-dependent methyltransferase [Leptospiraceae bacterium]MBK7058950.1 class I SAM-dependent methyltransferase [Leptospiraceae bacterium]